MTESKDSKFNVHLFALARVKVPSVTAKDAREAVQKALDRTDLYAALNRSCPTRDVEWTDYAEEVQMALVDVARDEEFARSAWFDVHGDEIEKADTGGSPEPTPADRVRRAERTVRHYSRTPGYKGEQDVESDITDLLADLQHLCRARALDFEALDAQAARHFAAEERGEEP